MGGVADDVLELLRQAYDAWNRGDRDWLAQRVSPDFEMHDLDVPDAPVFRGREGLLRNMTRIDDLFSEFELRVDDLIPTDDDRVLAFLHARVTGRGSGVELEQDIGHVWTVRDQVAVRLEIYLDQTRAREAAGLG